MLRAALAGVHTGHSTVIQAGDCAEDPGECTPRSIERKVALLDTVAGAMRLHTGKPVLRIGRIAGQFAKPRSRPAERCGDVELPAFRGHLVNLPAPDRRSRQPDPMRMLSCYWASRTAVGLLRDEVPASRVWTSHEALVLDYELPLLRRTDDDRLFLSSTHWPWIGDRTRQLDGAHVALLAGVANPVACKVGPSMTSAELVALCERLDPGREPGRLTLIARLGADLVSDRLPGLVSGVRAAGHPVIWLCDPMHGNTVTTPDGGKTRFLATITHEVRAFREAVPSGGGGLHLETTPDAVHECVTDEPATAHGAENYTSFCDPRLNPHQAMLVVDAWGRTYDQPTGARRHHP
ncbi:phospho-2-dehydro-3-deoxyheptonate aldolase [Amycolatopsis vancoresmycina DSM 44592]|uniref:Phospho-2-dehydro-3-deoxyheptonate aldolase n=2 Tax=Amycolatopsis vancoresmycina TaxID=208444 RepID=R1HSP2_9PSEU|nr:phospho-2-dehydro-3-deoxyheptonate aldolase [Amycolatopsis vancoresmycina DSM 44592]